jgi:hypothetical protein
MRWSQYKVNGSVFELTADVNGLIVACRKERGGLSGLRVAREKALSLR